MRNQALLPIGTKVTLIGSGYAVVQERGKLHYALENLYEKGGRHETKNS